MGENKAEKSVMGPASAWSLKSRYPLEDYDYSPSPPCVDGDFFHMHRPLIEKRKNEHDEKRESVYDRINQELGVVVENGDRRVSVSQVDKRRNSHTSLHISHSGISLAQESSPSPADLAIFKLDDEDKKVLSQKTKALISESILDASIGRDRGLGSDEASTLQASCLDPATHFPLGSSSAIGHTHSIRQTIENISMHEMGSDLKSEQKTRKVGSLSSTEASVIPRIGGLPVMEDPANNKLFPKQSLNPMTKIVDRPAAVSKSHIANYFFTGGMFGSATAPSYTTTTPAGSLTHRGPMPTEDRKSPSPASRRGSDGEGSGSSSILQQRTTLIAEKETISDNLDCKTTPKRRPKPSVMREMNFYAPQSM